MNGLHGQYIRPREQAAWMRNKVEEPKYNLGQSCFWRLSLSALANFSEAFGTSTTLRTLVASVQELSFARTLEEVMRVVRRAARELVHADGATFILREGDSCFYADEDAISPLWKGKRFPMTECISGWAMLNGKTAVIPDIYADPRIPIGAYRITFVKSLVMVPIRPNSPLAAIGTYWKDHHHATAEEVELLQALANTTCVAMEDIRLHQELERVRQERPAAPDQSDEQVQANYGRLLEAHDRESRRLARELHDEIGQTLISSVLNLQRIQSLPPGQGTEVLEKTLTMMKQAVTEIRSIAHLLHPLVLDELSLAAAIRWHAQGFSERTRIPLELELVEDWETEALPPKTKATIFRVIQECLLNVQKHAGATGVFLRLVRNNGSMMLLVQDNGRGMPAGARAGVGIQSMMQRVQQLGGQMQIDSNPSGTRVHITLPR
jgi:signal transduction histidine kinase